jgi:hypothetical protein
LSPARVVTRTMPARRRSGTGSGERRTGPRGRVP